MIDMRAEFEAQIVTWSDVSTRYMFGCLAYLARGKLFAFINDGELVITNLDAESRQTLSENFEAFPFESKGQPVGGWMQVSVSDQSELTDLMEFVRNSYETALLKASSGK